MRIKRVKVRNLLVWDKGSLLGKAAQGINSSHLVVWQVLSTGKLGSVALMVAWEDRCQYSEHPPSPTPLASFPLHFTCWEWCHVVWNFPLVSWISCPHCVPSQLLAHPQPPCWWGGEQKRLWLCKCCSGLAKSSLWHCFQLKSNTYQLLWSKLIKYLSQSQNIGMRDWIIVVVVCSVLYYFGSWVKSPQE